MVTIATKWSLQGIYMITAGTIGAYQSRVREMGNSHQKWPKICNPKNIQIAKPNSECISNWDQNSGGLQFMGASIIKMTIYHVVIQSIVLNPTIIIMIKA